MTTRVLVFEDDDVTRKLLSTYLNAQGYEVLDFPSPKTCALVSEKACSCPRDSACADIVITDMNMPGMNGLELIRHQKTKGCKAPSRNKAVVSANLTPEQKSAFSELGCCFIQKPFRLSRIREWTSGCEENISPARKLVPLQDLWNTARAVAS